MPHTTRLRKTHRSRRIIFSYYDNRCVHCGEQFPFELLTCDHITPASLGGKRVWINLVPACGPCNNRRGNKLLPIEKEVVLLAKAKDSFEEMLGIIHVRTRWNRKKDNGTL